MKKQLRTYLQTDNHTNFLYIGRAWLIALLTMGAAIWCFESLTANELAFWWGTPVYLIAIIIIGASQHQLAGAGHEAVHHTLFKNRKLNELAADWLCMYPIMTSTFQFRLYHLAHHQFVNDPERDPDFALLKDSGHWMEFPVEKRSFLQMMLRQILLVDLVKYILVRVKYNTTGKHKDSPYKMSDDRKRVVPARLGVGFFLFLVLSLMLIQGFGSPWMLFVIPPVSWAVIATVLLRLPDRFFDKARIKPVFHQRYMVMGQTASLMLLLLPLAWVQMTSGFMALRYFSLLWYVPMLTTLPFFLILRQVIQHGNGDRGWLTNTRVFRMRHFVRYAIFPFGMDYHLPHHMYATIPHYRLRAFHDFLLTRPGYEENCQLVDNYLIPTGEEERNPTVVEVLGPEYAMASDEVHIDDTVLEKWEVEEKEEILKAGRPPSRPKPGPDLSQAVLD